jgi:hypothetical protein
MNTTLRTAFTGLACLCCLASLLTSLPTKAEVPLDGFYEIATDGSYYPYFIIENGNLKDASGFLYNPVCQDGEIQAPALVTDLAAFFEGHPVTRVIDRGNGHYLLTTSIDFDEHGNFRNVSPGMLNAVYAELDFTSATDGTFTLRVATAFFNGEGMGTSTCLARAQFDLNRVNS